MTEHSDAAKAAYPTLPRTTEAHWDMQRTAYDRGREDGEEMRDAHDSMEFPDSYAVTREALAAAIGDEPGSVWAESLAAADRILASDALVDVNEVKAEALEEAADDIQALHPGEVKASVERLRERAAGIRAGRP